MPWRAPSSRASPVVDQRALGEPGLERDDPEAPLADEVEHEALAELAELAVAVVVLADRDDLRAPDDGVDVVDGQDTHGVGQRHPDRLPCTSSAFRPPGGRCFHPSGGVALHR